MKSVLLIGSKDVNNLEIFYSGLPVIFHLFAHSIPVEERSRAFGYLGAAGSIGQVIESIVWKYKK